MHHQRNSCNVEAFLPNRVRRLLLQFDINCGVRLIRTNLTLADVEPVKEQLAQVKHALHWCNCCLSVFQLFVQHTALVLRRCTFGCSLIQCCLL
jgi:hypothetical protein